MFYLIMCKNNDGEPDILCVDSSGIRVFVSTDIDEVCNYRDALSVETLWQRTCTYHVMQLTEISDE